jgi:formylglycine-generating enzyme
MPRRAAHLSAAVLAIAGVAAIWGVRGGESGATTVALEIGGRTVAVETRGAGPRVMVLVERDDVSSVVRALAGRYQVWSVSIATLRGLSPADRRDLLMRFSAGGEVLVVALLPVLASALEALPTGLTLRLVALDAGGGGRVGRDDMERLFATSWPLFAFSSAPGRAWQHYRQYGGGPEVRVSLLEACAETLTKACADAAARLVDALHDHRSGPPTGVVLADTMQAGGRAPDTVVVPNGQFVAGRDDARSPRTDALRVFPVDVAARLAVATTETTVAQFRRFVRATGYEAGSGCWLHTVEQEWIFAAEAAWDAPPFAQTDDHPVTCVTFEDATAYAGWMTRETGATYRLPTEDEFEFFQAAGGMGPHGMDVKTPAQLCVAMNGADASSGLAYASPCDDGFAATAPAASFAPDAFGLHDTSGNVWEVTADCWQSAFGRRASRWWRGVAARWQSGEGQCPALHVIRGGSYLSSPANLRIASRDREGYRSTRLGFRVVRELR